MQIGPDAAQTPPKLTSNDTDPTITSSSPKTQYRVRIPANTVSEVPIPSRQGSIDGAPEAGLDFLNISEISLDAFEADLRVYFKELEESENKTHVSSSQKSQDGCETLTPPPSPSSWLDVDEDSLPTWMVKKGQWKYITSAAGGPAWEKLLKVYMLQERRLGFMEKASTFTSFPHLQP